jgi:RNA recognition motif-containing protein
MNIYVSNLSFNIQDKELSSFFTEYGEVSSAKVIMDKMTSRSRGFGFVEMPDDEASKKAIAALDGTTIDGRTIKVTEARQKEQRPARRDHTDGGYNNSNSYNENRY